MTLEDISPLELPAAHGARVGGGDPALVALVPDQGGLVEVAPAAPVARVLLGGVPGVAALAWGALSTSGSSADVGDRSGSAVEIAPNLQRGLHQTRKSCRLK